MRQAVASFAVSVLMAITTFCPLLACVPAQAAPHCHHSKGTPKPPCDSGSPSCPYLLLEKTKSQPASHFAPPAPQLYAPAQFSVIERLTANLDYLPNAAGIYLLNRVLLI